MTPGDIWLVKLPGATTLGMRKILEIAGDAIKLGTVEGNAPLLYLPVQNETWYKVSDLDFVTCYFAAAQDPTTAP